MTTGAGVVPSRSGVVALAVCVITYRRPMGLEKLLAHLSRQEGVDAGEILVVVVDNDPDLSAGSVVEAARKGGAAIAYAHEPVPGIPKARNRSVEIALQSGARHLCFLDDDEFPAATWLTRLLAHFGTSGAPVVTGPVLSVLPAGTPAWMAQSRLFSRPRYTTGERRDRAATNNVMVDRRVFETMDSWFDEAVPFAGGTDGVFFRRAHRAGFEIEWCDEAVVYEDVPRERCTLRWISRRNLREGLDTARLAFEHGGDRAAATFDARALLGVARGLLRCMLTLGLVPAVRLRLVENLSWKAGLVLGRFGMTIDEYRRPAGGKGLRERPSDRPPAP